MTARAFTRLALFLSFVLAAVVARGQGGALTLTELAAPGQGLFTASISDSFAATGVASADDWSFEAETGDRITVRVEATVGSSRPKLRLLNLAGTALVSVDGGTNGVAEFYNYAVTAPGSLRVRVYTDNAVSAYGLRVDLSRFGPTMETEVNDTVDASNTPAFAPAGGSSATARLHGILTASDTGDFQALGELNAGSTIQLNASLPSGSTLAAGDISMALWRSRRAERSLQFSGAQYATIPHSSVFDSIETNRVMTLESWINISSFPSGWFTILDKYEATGDFGWAFAVENNSNGLQLYTSNGVRRVSGVQIPVNRWTHVAVTYNPAAAVTTERVRFYVNGVLVSSGTSPGNLVDTSGEPAYLGFSLSGGDEYNSGRQSELRLWNVVRTPAEIQASYLNQLVGNEAGLVGYWRFSEGSGTTAQDLTATANHATLGGGTESTTPGWSAGPVRPLSGTLAAPEFVPSSYTGNPGEGQAQGGSWNYFDDGAAQLTDGILGQDSIGADLGNGPAFEWVGWITVDPTYTFNFAAPTPVRAVEIGFARCEGCGVSLPSSVTVNGTVYPLSGTEIPDNTRGFLSFPLTGSVSSVTVTLADGNAGRWIFVDEINFLGSTPSSTSLTYSVTEPGQFFSVISAAGGRSLTGRYLVNTTLTEPAALAVESTSLPSEGGSTDGFLQSATVMFNGQLDPAAALNPAHYDLRGPGIDSTYGTEDDVVYTFGTLVYDGSRTVTIPLANGPLQTGPVRFRVLPTLTNRFGTAMAATFTRNFTVTALAMPNGTGFVLEDMDNNSVSAATPLAPVSASVPSGAFANDVPSIDIRSTGTGSWQPVDVGAARLRGPGQPLDLVALSESDNSVSVLLGVGNGTFAAPVRYAVQSTPWQLKLADMDGDGDVDIVTGNRNSDSVSILKNNGNGTFAAATNFAVNDHPSWLALADIDADGDLDVITSGYNAGVIGVCRNNGSGALGAVTTYAIADNPNGLDAGDVDGDGDKDLVVAGYNGRRFQVMLNDGTGLFTAGASLVWATDSNDAVEALQLADMDGDGALDIVGQTNSRAINGVFRGNGNGTFAATPVEYRVAYDYDNYKLTIADVTLDGKPDIVMGNAQRISVVENRSTVGNLAFGGANWRHIGSWMQGQCVGDFNGDGLPDIAAAQRDAQTVRLLFGIGQQPLPLDVNGGSAADVRTIAARGNVNDASDEDWWSFSAKAGERILITTSNVIDGTSMGLRYRLWQSSISTENWLLDGVSDYYTGSGQWYLTAPATGTYYIQVAQYYPYRGEYRLQISTAPGSFTPESEGNDSRSSGDHLTWTRAPGLQTASAIGYLLNDDPSDYLRLGNLTDGVEITLSLAKPPSSTLSYRLELWNNTAGTPVAQGAEGQAVLNYTIPVGGIEYYFARVVLVTPTPSRMDSIFSQYQLGIQIADTIAPTVTGSTLPTPGQVLSNSVLDTFSLTFSEDMMADSINNLANYQLVWSGPNLTFDDLDDVVLPLELTSVYSSGRTANYRAVNTPLMPGNYRFRAYTTLVDGFLNPMASVFERLWSIATPSGTFVYEGLSSNGSAAEAVELAPQGAGWSGSWNTPIGSIDIRAGGSTTSWQPVAVGTARLRGPGQPLDLVTVNESDNSVSVLLGNGDGTFAAATRYAVQSTPWDVELKDMDGDGDIDIVTGNRNSDSISLLRNNGSGVFAAAVNTTVNDHPAWLAVGDLDGNGSNDVVTSGYYAGVVGIRLNNGDGTFQPQTTVTVAGGPNGLDIGDADGDGDRDIIVARYDARKISILLNNGSGTFTAGSEVTWTNDTNDPLENVQVADMDGDGVVDIVAQTNSRAVYGVFRGNGNGTFADPVIFRGPYDYDNYKTVLGDFNGDGKVDILTGNAQRISIVENLSTAGNLSFSSPNWTHLGSWIMGVTFGDFNNDGRMDFAATQRDAQTVRLLLGRGSQQLPLDVAVGTPAGIRTVAGRGNISSTSDEDWWSFSAKAGERILITTIQPTDGSTRSLRYRLWQSSLSTENWLLDTTSDYYTGSGQWSFTAPTSGTYYLQIYQYYAYRGEYRFAVSTLPGTLQLESEDNGSKGGADVLSYSRSTGQQAAQVVGALLYDDTGDFYQLGNLAEGTVITLAAAKPPSSALTWLLEVFNASGSSPVAAGTAGSTPLVYTVPAGQSGAYYARVRIGTAYAVAADSLLSLYQLSITLADVQAPSISGSSLPTDGTVLTNNLVTSFSISFSEDMEAGSVNTASNYELVWAGPNGTFDGGGDDQVLPITPSSTYASGLSHGFVITDTPMMAGNYRFRVGLGLLDRYLNPLAAVFERTWSIAPPSGSWISEEQTPNNSAANAIPLAASGAAWSGSWSQNPELIDTRVGGTGDYRPVAVSLSRLRGPAQPYDLVTLHENDSSITVRLGSVDGTTWAAPVRYAVGATPWDMRVLDLNGDSFPDIVTSNRNGNSLSVLLGTGTGTFSAPTTYAQGVVTSWLTVADFNGDARPDVASTGYNNGTVSVRINNGDGTFGAITSLSIAGGVNGLDAGDIDNDGDNDLVIARWDSRSVICYVNDGFGTFTAGTVLSWSNDTNDPLETVAIADFDGDGNKDLLVTTNSRARMSVWSGAGDGTFALAATPTLNVDWDLFKPLVKDLNGDGRPEILIGDYYYIVLVENLSTPGVFQFASPSWRRFANYGALGQASEDVNNDGHPDLFVAVRDAQGVYRFNGLPAQQPPLDVGGGSAAGVRSISLRGNISSASDEDWYSFSARAGERIQIATVNYLTGSAEALSYRLYQQSASSENWLLNSTSDYYSGSAHWTFTAPSSGTYYLQVSQYYAYRGEYRVQITTLPATFQNETEYNGARVNANALPFTLSAGSQNLKVAGYLINDDDGDFIRLGNLGAGTQITLGTVRPPSSILQWRTEVWNGTSGSALATSDLNAATLSYTIPAGGEGVYYARIRIGTAAPTLPESLFSQYQLNITLADTSAPVVTSTTLPAAGSSSSELVDRFTLTFSEDLESASANLLSNYEFRGAGLDDTFNTSDDVLYTFAAAPGYTSGLSLSLRLAGGSLSPGRYLFTVGSGITDSYLNPLTPFTQEFRIVATAGYTTEVEANDTPATGTPMVPLAEQTGQFVHGGRGKLLDTSDLDYFQFNAQAGDKVLLYTEIPGSPGASALRYAILNPAGGIEIEYTGDYYGTTQFAPFTISSSGTHTLRVRYYYDYRNEYRFRLLVLRGVTPELEENGTLGTATPLTLATVEGGVGGTAGGLIFSAGEFDYYSLGTVNAGSTIFVSSRLSSASPLLPVVGVYNAAGSLVAEATGGRAGDGVAQVPVSVTGTYYALIRASGSTNGILSDYLLDALILPTGGATFPNLVATWLTLPPALGLSSGDPTTLSFRIDNVGSTATGAAAWTDRVVLSTDTIYGNGDDIELALFPHSTVLGTGESYTVNSPVALPDGIEGTFYLIVRTDSGNTVNEFILEGDNETVGDSTVQVALATYPDLRPEDFAVSAPTEAGVYTISWTLANRGSGNAPLPFSERVFVRNNSTNTVVLNSVVPAAAPLAAGATLARSATVTTLTPGSYTVEVTVDSGSNLYEFTTGGHLIAEQNNIATGGFNIFRSFTIALAADPVGTGNVSGGGTFPEGTSRTVVATPIAPNTFIGWFEGVFLRSSNPSYTFSLNADRNLVARFSLPQYLLATQVNPIGAGSVTGGGVYPLNTLVNLGVTAAPGYLFQNWTEGATVLGSGASLPVTVTGARTIVANFAEANPTHTVTTATSPAGVAVISGAGVYANGVPAVFTAPATVVDGDTEYVFQRFTLNGTQVTTSTTFSRSFTTLDAPSLALVAVYNSRSLKPVVSSAAGSPANPVGAGRDFRLTLRFDRTMDVNIPPSLAFVGVGAPAIPATGSWTSSSVSNDTWQTSLFQFSAGQDGSWPVQVSGARDTQGRVMDAATALTVVVDTIAPPAPVPVVVGYTNSTVNLEWNAYSAPADIGGFRVYRHTATFATTAGQTAVLSLGAAARTATVSGLSPDTDYYVAVTAVDNAGNALTSVTPVLVRIVSTVPPPVPATLTSPALTTARLNWTGYDTAALLGFDGFRVYRQETPFSSVTGLTPIATLASGVRSYDDPGRDRTRTYYYAVVGVNRLGEFNPAVTTVTWSDPLAAPVTANLTIGGAGEADIPVFFDITVLNNATLTIRAGTVLRFAPGTGLTVTSGRLVTQGTPIEPVVLTSETDDADAANGTPAPGQWEGVLLNDATQSSSLAYSWIKYGRGLRLTAGTATLDTFSAVWNTGSGLLVSGASSTLTTSKAYLAFNQTGASVGAGATLTLTGSVLKNNTTFNAANLGGTFNATANWWGATTIGGFLPTISGLVNTSDFLTSEPVLSSAVAAPAAGSNVNTQSVNLRVGSVNAASYRISEDSSFTGALFIDLPGDEVFNTYVMSVPFLLSDGAGSKTVYLQLRSISGSLSPVVSVVLNYVTDGPVITGFSLTEGQTITRPLTVTGSATATIGLSQLRFVVANATVNSTASSPLSSLWDIRSLTPGTYRVRFEAVDNATNLATRALNVQVTPQPAPAPVITAPANGAFLVATSTPVSGTAEPGIEVRLTRNGAFIASTTAAGNGSFSFASVSLVEGINALVATATDILGSTSSATVSVVSDTQAPAAVNLLAPAYRAGEGLFLDWELPTSGEVPSSYRVFWHTAPFTSTAQATGSTTNTTLRTDHVLTGIPDGTWYFAVVGYDGAGNPSPLSNLRSYALDATRPTFTLAYNSAAGLNTSPVGPGDLAITVTASEALEENPLVLLRLSNNALLSLRMTAAGANTYTGTFPVTYLAAVSGPVALGVSGTDLAGNFTSGAPSGPALVLDLTRPTGAITTSLPSPVHNADPVSLSVNLALSEVPAPGTVPTLTFSPPSGGAAVAIPLTGSALAWSGQLTVNAAMGTGEGSFNLTVTDAVGNEGFGFTSGDKLELYTSELPPAPGAPAGLSSQTRPGGVVRLTWTAATNAVIYRLYREAGGGAATPTVLVADNIADLTFDDTPPTDGTYRYAVRASRLGSEGPASNVRVATSDRTAPLPPASTAATLIASGVRVEWTAPASGETPVGYRIYRNGVSLGTAASPGQITDSPPRGVINYQIASYDSVGNESLGPIATLELLVGAVNNLNAIADVGGAVQLTWTSGDVLATGYHIARNGVRQTATPLAALTYTDPLPRDNSAPVTYSVTAVNALGQESAARVVTVAPLDISVSINPTDSGPAASVAHYFDKYRVSITPAAGAGTVVFTGGKVNRTVTGETPLALTFPLAVSVAASATHTVEVAVPAPNTVGVTQTFQVVLEQSANLGGSTVSYRFTSETAGATDAALQLKLSAFGQAPLAGGLADFTAQVFNRGYMPADLVLSRGNNTEAGECVVQIYSGDTLVAEYPVTASASGMFFSEGAGFVRVAPGASVSFTIHDILVPVALAGQTDITFVARFRNIYNSYGSTYQRSTGELIGDMPSQLRETPYYGTAFSALTAFSNNTPVTITGQAINRATGNPMPNTPLRIGILVQGAKLFESVTTDGTGSYSFNYTPPFGIAGSIQLWAAHPDVVDLLNQVRLDYFRIFTKPGRADIVMSKNDYLNFDIALLNLGDNQLAGATVSSRAYRVVEGVETEVPQIVGSLREPIAGPIAGKAEVPVRLRLDAAADAPNDAIVEFTVTTTEGASSKFTGNVQLRPAVPILTVTAPTEGYALTSLDRGQQKLITVTVTNRGLRALEGVTLVPPAGVTWMDLGVSPDATAPIALPDIPVGGSAKIDVVFSPPAGTPVGYYDDFFLIRGTNATADFRVNLFARVTSNLTGSAEFSVKNILGDAVPNAALSLRDGTLGTERGPVSTDVNGVVVFNDLMEGDWQWRISAPGHGSKSGVIKVVAGETVLQDIEMTLALVTVKFSVVPVPFTDYYEIKIEQTFSTYTPVPNLVLTPAHQSLSVAPGFVGTVLYKLKNTGLRSAFDVKITGQSMPTMRLTPLISYMPELAAQQEVEIPTLFEYFGPATPSSPRPALIPRAEVPLVASIGAGKGTSSSGSGSSAGLGGVVVRGASDFLPPGPAQDAVKCYEDFKYGTITLQAAGGVSSTSGAEYTVGVNATIDVDELIALLCEGDCPDSWTGDSIGGQIAGAACDEILGKIVEAGQEANKAYDIICKATNIIKAIACALAQLDSSASLGGGDLGPGTGGGTPGCWCGPGGPGIDYGGCFEPSTAVTLADGSSLRVDALQVGQKLRASSGGVNAIANLVRRTSDHLRELHLAGGDGVARVLRLTHDHRLWVEGRGWMLAHDIPAGSTLRGQDGKPVSVMSNTRVPGSHEVVLVQMDGDTALFAEGVLAEDQCVGAERRETVNLPLGGLR